MLSIPNPYHSIISRSINNPLFVLVLIFYPHAPPVHDSQLCSACKRSGDHPLGRLLESGKPPAHGVHPLRTSYKERVPTHHRRSYQFFAPSPDTVRQRVPPSDTVAAAAAGWCCPRCWCLPPIVVVQDGERQRACKTFGGGGGDQECA